ncbi:MAG: peptidoglycan-binding protein [Candidatus Peribacteria bacterium]|nr:MAG: peptidoglycan-binding protein [Candidatus Peribacteria bacterium]
MDLDTPFHPYYYDSKTCPYSYNDISETGVCFDELARNTVDPLLLLETDGKILDDVQVTEVKTVSRQEIEQNNIVSDTHYNYDMSIFDRTVYDGYPVEDIKEVQMIFRDLGEYNGPISGNYSDVEEAIISYQLSNNIISARGELGTGWFGPKTRTQAKNDYQNYLASGGERKTDRQVEIANNVKTEKISRDGLLSRDEIEKREVEDFIKHNDIELNLKNVGGNIELGTTSILKLEITNNKGRPFKGNMPSGMTFTVDSNKVKVFPSKLYYFTDGKRDIQLTGIGAGNTTLYVKIGNQVIKSIPLKVYDTGKQVEPEIGAIITNKSIVLGDNKTGIVVFRDENKKNLINLRYE